MPFRKGENCNLKLPLASPSQNKGRQVSGACVWPAVTALSESLMHRAQGCVLRGRRQCTLFQSLSLSCTRRQVYSQASAQERRLGRVDSRAPACLWTPTFAVLAPSSCLPLAHQVRLLPLKKCYPGDGCQSGYFSSSLE